MATFNIQPLASRIASLGYSEKGPTMKAARRVIAQVRSTSTDLNARAEAITTDLNCILRTISNGKAGTAFSQGVRNSYTATAASIVAECINGIDEAECVKNDVEGFTPFWG